MLIRVRSVSAARGVWGVGETHGKGAHRLVRPLVWVGLTGLAPEIMSG